MQLFKSLSQLPRTVWLIGLISLVNDSASEMLYPLIPLYLSAVLMAGPKALGLIEGVAEATASLLKLFSGVLMDRTRRAKPWIVVGYGLVGLGRPLIAFVTSWPWLMLIRFTDRVGKGLRTSPRDALLAAVVGPNRRGLAFGLHRAMDNAGAVVGPLIAWALLASDVPLKEIFLWSAVPAALCVILAMCLKDVPGEQLTETHRFNWRDHRISAPMKRYLVVVGLFSLGNASSMFLLLRAGELGIAQQDIPLLWAAVSIIPTLFSTPLAAWSDKIGRVRLLLAGYTAYGAVYVVLAYMGHASFWLFALYALYGLFLAATEGVEKALVADLAPASRQGTAFGWFNMVTGFCLLPASITFGWLYQDVSASAAFMFSGCCGFGSALLMLLWWKRFSVSPSLR
jgi:MFS family permease